MKYLNFIFALLFFFYSDLSAQRFFKTHSTWYEKIPGSANVIANSQNYISDILINGSSLFINNGVWSTTFWMADANTPKTNVIVTHQQNFKYDFIINNGWNLDVPIPLNAAPPGEYDGLVAIIGPDKKYIWDIHQFENRGDGVFAADLIFRWELDGDGVDCPVLGMEQMENPFLPRSPRVAGTPLGHGMIMYDEMKAGIIEHALGFAYWGSDYGEGVYPSCVSNAELNPRTWALKLGMRLQLDPNLDIESLGLSRAGKIIAKALQDYGAIYIENDGVGSNSIYAESLSGKSISWNDLGPDGNPLLKTSDILKIPINKLRIVEPIYPSEPPDADTTPPNAPNNLSVEVVE